MLQDIVMENQSISLVYDTRTTKVPLSITKRVLEGFLRSISYRGEGWVCDPEVEQAQLPPIAKTFYELMATQLPKPEEVMKYYLLEHFWFSKQDPHRIFFESEQKWYSTKGVLARIYRTYPSLMRDFHFFLLCSEYGEFDRVRYSLRQDVSLGVDLLVSYQGQDYAVSLYVDTKRGTSFKKKKYRRHKRLTIPEICLPIDPFDEKRRVGQFALYQANDLELLLRQIHDFQTSQYTRQQEPLFT
ncbi:hypothetical protein [Geobacillus subterraneus]|uniref:Uncharacterized protein n=1 Tax=Geobacillus subterraneus TaxID=129338 RepID=A0A679FS70_9BACL|nr:hypothetical protein [Geobacillus subterraneus]BBW98993.1 hypothetical protein GsuE55_38260 [Geobacillus subterraneus]